MNVCAPIAPVQCGFDYIPASRKSKACAICKKRVGYCVSCSWSGRSGKTSKSKGCDAHPFHVFCASRAGAQGYRVRLKEVPSGDDDFSVAKLMHCPTHSVARFDPKAWLAEQRKAKRAERSDPKYWEKLKQSAKADTAASSSKGKKKGKGKRKRSEPTAEKLTSSSKGDSNKADSAGVAHDNASPSSSASWLKSLPVAASPAEDSGDEGKSDISDGPGEAGEETATKRTRVDAAAPAPSSASAASSGAAAAVSSNQASVKSPAELRQLEQFYQRVLHTEAAAMADTEAQFMGAIIPALPLPRLASPVQSSAATLPAATAAAAASSFIGEDIPASASFQPLAAELGAGSAIASAADEELQRHLDPLPPLLPLFNSEGEMSEFSVLAQVSHRVLSPLVPVGGVRAATPSVLSRVGSSPSPLGVQRPRPAAGSAADGSFSTPSRPDEHVRAFDGKENAGSLLLNISRSSVSLSQPWTPASGTSFTFQTPTQSGSAVAAADLHLHTPSSLQSFDTPPEVAAAAAAAAAAAKSIDAATPKQPAAVPSGSSSLQHAQQR